MLNLIKRIWTTLTCEHKWDTGTLVDIGRNKIFYCEKEGCCGMKSLDDF